MKQNDYTELFGPLFFCFQKITIQMAPQTANPLRAQIQIFLDFPGSSIETVIEIQNLNCGRTICYALVNKPGQIGFGVWGQVCLSILDNIKSGASH